MSHHRNVDNSTPVGSTNDAGHQKLMSGRPPSAVRSGPAWLTTMLVALLVVRAAMFPFIVVAQQSAPAKATEDLPRGTMQAKATSSCLECHEARIILQQRLSKAAWTKEVDKMIKWGAVVDTSDHDALIDYLSSHFSPDRPSYEPPRTSIQKASGK
jgi:hypothetical protein